VKYIIIRKKYK